MKRSGFDDELNMLNKINLTKQESTESYQKIFSKVNKVKKRKGVGISFRATITGIATILVLVTAGWFLNDLVNNSMNQPGEQIPVIVENDDHVDEQDDHENEQTESETVDDDQPIVDVETISCVESSDMPSSDSGLISIYFECPELHEQQAVFKPVLREVNSEDKVEERIEFAVRQVIQGPTEQEMEKGYLSIFNKDTADLLNSIELQDSGHLIVDFVDFSKIIPNGSASAASFAMMGTLNKTVSQFSEVETMEYRFDGSCENFYAWIQQVCMPYQADDYRVDVEEHKQTLLEKSEVLVQQLLTMQWEEFANHLHPERGLVYSPYSNVGDSDDLQFLKEEVEKFTENQQLYSWSWNQSENEFVATPNDFVENLLKKRDDYVYDYGEITYNDSEVGTMINTIHDIYPDAIYVEYLDEPDKESPEWYYYQALRFVYEEIENEWYLVALVRGAYNP